MDVFADRAQTDLGMDYAWLDDVSTTDWSRYHDLKRGEPERHFKWSITEPILCPESKRFAEIFQAIYNGTHADLPENVAVKELAQVKTVLQEIKDGFEYGVAKLRREAASAARDAEERKEELQHDAPKDTAVEEGTPRHEEL